MAKRKENHGGKRSGAGRPPSYGSAGRAVRCSFSAPEKVAERLGVAARQIGASQSQVVLAGLLGLLELSPDRLADEVRRRVG